MSYTSNRKIPLASLKHKDANIVSLPSKHSQAKTDCIPTYSKQAANNAFANLPDLSFSHIRTIAKFNIWGTFLIALNAIAWGITWIFFDSWLMSGLSFSTLLYANYIYTLNQKGLYYKSLIYATVGISFWICLVAFVASGPGLGFGGSVHAYFLCIAVCLFLCLQHTKPFIKYGAPAVMLLLFFAFHLPLIDFKPFIDLSPTQHLKAGQFTWASVPLLFIVSVWLLKTNNIYDQKITFEDHRLDDIFTALNAGTQASKFDLTNNAPKFACAIPHCSVMLLDFSNLSTLLKEHDQQWVAQRLNNIMGEFDNALYNSSLDKINSLDGFYMVASGVSKKDLRHAENLTDLAMEFMLIAQNFPEMEIKIAIHSGAANAAVISESKFLFALWGSSVTAASDILRNTNAHKICLSKSTYKIVKDRYNCNYYKEISSYNAKRLELFELNDF